MPTLAGIPPGGQPPMPGPPEQGAGAALPKLVFQIEQSLDTLARALPPDAAEKINTIKDTLREAVAISLSGGGQPPEGPAQQGGPY
jgi:hypothetical protein